MREAAVFSPALLGRPLRSRRLLALAGDERLVEQIRRGNEAAFEVAFERYSPAVLGFCRHMLGSPEEAEDAVQHTFAAAYRDLRRDVSREIALKPWLFTIARNRCVSILRARREEPVEGAELPTAGLADQVERRAELRDLLRDLRELPEEQRAALLLAELGDLSHAEVAGVLGCEVPHVKALVYRARSGLIARRSAREVPCEEIREQVANLRGGALRRTELRLHLRVCPGCREFREQVRLQRKMLSVALPVAPGLGLKAGVLGLLGLGGGSAGGGAAVGGTFLGSGVAKVAIAGVLAGGAVVATGPGFAPGPPAGSGDNGSGVGRGEASVRGVAGDDGVSGPELAGDDGAAGAAAPLRAGGRAPEPPAAETLRRGRARGLVKAPPGAPVRDGDLHGRGHGGSKPKVGPPTSAPGRGPKEEGPPTSAPEKHGPPTSAPGRGPKEEGPPEAGARTPKHEATAPGTGAGAPTDKSSAPKAEVRAPNSTTSAPKAKAPAPAPAPNHEAPAPEADAGAPSSTTPAPDANSRAPKPKAEDAPAESALAPGAKPEQAE